MRSSFTLLLLLAPALAFAQADTTKKTMSPKFIAAMEKQVAILDTAFTPATLQQCYNTIERVSKAEKGEWLPPYYMAYCLVLQSFSDDQKKVDDYCDKADLLLARADSLSPRNSEIYVLRAMCASARIRVNPMSRGAKFGGMSSVLLDSAQAINPENPRIYLLRGQGLFYTPPAFGGGKDKAKPVIEDAIKKYDAFVAESVIHPRWGRPRAQMLLAECNK